MSFKTKQEKQAKREKKDNMEMFVDTQELTMSLYKVVCLKFIAIEELLKESALLNIDDGYSSSVKKIKADIDTVIDTSPINVKNPKDVVESIMELKNAENECGSTVEALDVIYDQLMAIASEKE